jgi:putative SOS response-associated peptidase YedK
VLTTAPGLDVAPYHQRQLVMLDRADWARWLDPGVSAKTILKPLPSGSLKVEQISWTLACWAEGEEFRKR